uniref:Retrovirus-related Pol polyprotein from transposon 412 family n=1 Tax=Cajanus cajan TaxID=3821 RepID=A0A151SWQ1_CAJCA|nr:Retrovirus-related Pol polyprotein from transposon 412 family [Cajanus cajan]
MGLPPLRGIEHQIDLVPGASLPNRLAYRTNPQETKEIESQVQELLEKGWVRKSLSPCVVPGLLVPKKEGKWRMCCDSRVINNVSVKYRHPIPGLDDMLDELHGAVHVDPEKIKVIQEWPTPKSVGDIRSFHGLASFYRRFVPNFSTLASTLNELVKKNVEFQWGEKQERPFLALKDKLPHAPLLALPDFSRTFELECDASGVGIGAVLLQGKNNVVADALSRRHILLVSLGSQILGFDYIKELYSNDSEFNESYTQCLAKPQGGFYVYKGYLYKEGRICIPQGSVRKLLIKENHEGGLMGHFGVDKTLSFLKEKFFWPT